MLVDVSLINGTVVLTVHKKLFQNKTFPLTTFQTVSPLMEKYSQYGTFAIADGSLGFDRCFQIHESTGDYDIFSFHQMHSKLSRRKMILTIYLLTEWVTDQMFYYKEFFSDGIWDDQALSFNVFNGGEPRNGYCISGKLYPWFKKQLALLSPEQLLELNAFVQKSLNKVSITIQNRELRYSQLNIKNNSFAIVIDAGGRWIEWSEKRGLDDRCGEFHSHNIDFSSDQELCFIAIVLMNTWLRQNVENRIIDIPTIITEKLT